MKTRILIVDDEIEIGKLISSFLAKYDFEVLVADNAETALDIFDKERVDLMILDKKMPGMGSIALLEELERREIKIPVIVLTGSHDVPEMENAIKNMGYTNFMYKPADLYALLDNVKNVLYG
jgi:two-component system nitrogen regulation response regulator NtrX